MSTRIELRLHLPLILLAVLLFKAISLPNRIWNLAVVRSSQTGVVAGILSCHFR
jgi:hypothetical protein